MPHTYEQGRTPQLPRSNRLVTSRQALGSWWASARAAYRVLARPTSSTAKPSIAQYWRVSTSPLPVLLSEPMSVHRGGPQHGRPASCRSPRVSPNPMSAERHGAAHVADAIPRGR
jgi:hypothetical protein